MKWVYEYKEYEVQEYLDNPWLKNEILSFPKKKMALAIIKNK